MLFIQFLTSFDKQEFAYHIMFNATFKVKLDQQWQHNEDSDNAEYWDLKKRGGFLDSLDISIDGLDTTPFFTSWYFYQKYISFVELVTVLLLG